jgi:hypothetical protein
MLARLRGVLLDIDGTITTAGRLGAAAYDALERLQSAGLWVIPVTGRPAGWCDTIARFWPVDAKGKAQEKIYDIVWSGSRKPAANGKLPPVGDTVDVAKATWTNTIGAPELAAAWKDPDFKPSQRAFHYARVIEIPTPRWTAYDQLRFGVQMPKDVPMKHQERAWTSPIWYSPES